MESRAIRTIYLINGLGRGGAEMMLYRLLERLNREVFSPVVVALLKFPGPLQEEIEALGIEVQIVGLRSKLDIFAYYKLYRLIKDLSPVILHTQLFAADILGRVIGRMLKIPVIITSIRNIYYGGFGRNLMIRWTERFADRTTFVSEAAVQRFGKLKIVPAEKAQVIYNGLDADSFYCDLSNEDKMRKREELKLPQEGFLLLAVGSLNLQKGYLDLLNALQMIQGVADDLRLVVAGSGPLKKKLRSKAEELGLQEKVIFMGRCDNVPKLMAAADALVLSSLWEGLPGVVLEAMASELPVVATAVGGTPELVLDGETGYLVPAESPEKLAQALEKIIRLPEEQRRSMGKAGLSRVKEHFHVDKMVKAYEELYYECLQEKNLV